jgi:hypothetical protein
MVKKMMNLKVFLPVLIILTISLYFVGNYQGTHSASTYTARMTISLGTPEKDNLTSLLNPDIMRKKVLSTNFLEENLKISSEEIQAIKPKITINKLDETTAQIVVTDTKEAGLENTATMIANGYLDVVSDYSEEKKKMINETIDRIKDKQVSEEEVYDAEKFIYTLKLEEMNTEKPTVIEPVQLTEEHPSGLKQGIITSLLTFSFLIAVYLLLVIFNIRKYLK